VTAIAVLIVMVFAAVVAFAFGGGSSNNEKTNVLTTLPLFADFVREVGGDRVVVDSLIPPGINPDYWQPGPADAGRVAAADMVFANGHWHDFEPASMLQFLRSNMKPGAPLVSIAGDDEELERAGAEIFHDSVGGGHQQVLWMSVQNGKAYAQFIRQELSKFDPDGEETYSRNAQDYFDRIDEVERYAFHRLDDIPPENKKLITPDTSLEYFGSYYAVELTAQLSFFPGQQLDAEDLERIKQTIVERDVMAVFVDPYESPPSDLLRQAANETGVPVCTLYSDSLDQEVSTYLELIRFDADELHRCLGGGNA
jgi:ABC-type Zn uptake system ZnuABC Zn-binding protein ZnuA